MGTLSYSSVWARTARAAQLDPNSVTLMAHWQSTAVVTPQVVMTNFSVATAIADPANSTYTVPMTQHNGSLDSNIRIPAGTLPDPSSDGHLSIYDPLTNRIHDLWQARYSSVTDAWSCASGASSTPIGDGLPIAIGSNNNVDYGSNASNFPLQAGLLKPEEISQGQINHALVFGQPNSGTGKRYPATGVSAGTDVSGIPMGTWLALDPVVNIGILPLRSWEVTVARALQDYGMFLRDVNSSLVVYCENTINRGGPQLWIDVGMAPNNTGAVVFSAAFPWSSMKVLQAPLAS